MLTKNPSKSPTHNIRTYEEVYSEKALSGKQEKTDNNIRSLLKKFVHTPVESTFKNRS